jgi:hypothetical protein
VIVALLGARTAPAGPINFTGFVGQDFTGPGVTTIVNFPGPDGQSIPDHVGQDPRITALGFTTGFSIKDLRTSYDARTDTMYVGVNFFSIAGDADGNGDPGAADPRLGPGIADLPHLGGRKSISVAFAPDGANGTSAPGTPVVVAGVPADKTTAGPGIDGFNVSAYKGNGNGIAYNYGPTLTNNLGQLAFDPSAAHPGFEFTINNFSKIPGLNPANGFWITAYAGSLDAVMAGEDAVPWTRIPALAAQTQTIPEPTTLLAWSLVAGGAAWCARRRVPIQGQNGPSA